MSVYKDVKKGYKIGITQAVNENVRTHVFENGWILEDDNVLKILDNVLFEYSARVVDSLMDSQDKKIMFRQELCQKIIDSYEEFARKEPTPKQIWYYVNLSLEVGEHPTPIYNNKAMFKEIDRLKLLIEEGVV